MSRLRRKIKRLMLYTRLAIPILVVARAIPIVLMNSAIRSFCSANTCSTRERIFDFAWLARRVVSCIVALLNLTVQRVSRSLCRSLAALAFQFAGIRPFLIAFFSSSVLRWRGAALSADLACIFRRGVVPGERTLKN
jgi:hypothetical protein